MTQNLIPRWEIVLFEPRVKVNAAPDNAERLSVLVSATVDMVNGQEGDLVFAATSALAAVVCHYFNLEV